MVTPPPSRVRRAAARRPPTGVSGRPSAAGGCCSPRSSPRPRPGPAPWWRSAAATAARTPGWSARFYDRVIESGPGTAPWTGRWKAASRPAGRSRRCTRLPRSVCRTTPGTTPPRCHGHRQRPIGVAGVVMLAQRESQHAAGGHVHHRGDFVESELSQLSVLTCRTSTIRSRVAVGREPIWCGVAPRPWRRHTGKQTYRLGCGRARDASLSRRVAQGCAELADLRRCDPASSA
jgi:hypothetical protein